MLLEITELFSDTTSVNEHVINNALRAKHVLDDRLKNLRA